MRLKLPDVSDVPWAALDGWLERVLGVTGPWTQVEGMPERVKVAAGLAARIFSVGESLLRAARVPVFDAAQIRIIRSESEGGSTHIVVEALVATVDLLPRHVLTIVYQTSLKLVHRAFLALTGAGEFDMVAARAIVQEQVLGRIQGGGMFGISTVPTLHEAWKQHIPTRHLGAGVFQLGYGSGARRLSLSSIDTDSAIGARLANVKTASAAVLRVAGLPCPEHIRVHSQRDAVAAATRIGWPVVVKPADRERSDGVSVNLNDAQEVEQAFLYASRYSKNIVVERHVAGVCHRVMVANARFLYALWRRPMSVTGNGVDDVETLLNRAQLQGEKLPEWVRDKTVPVDELTRKVLASQGLGLDHVPGEGVRVPVRFVESTEWGEDRGDASGYIHPANADLAERAARVLGLSNAGVDIISADISRPWYENGAVINEVNFSPHFGGTSVARAKMPEFMSTLMQGDGRIPVEAFLGGDKALKAAMTRQHEWISQGLRAWVITGAGAIDSSGKAVTLSCTGSFEWVLASLMDDRVDAVCIVIRDAQWLRSGAPLDCIDALHRFEGGDFGDETSALRMKLEQYLLSLVRP